MNHSMVLYWLMRRPQCISWPNCVEAPGCHLTICGGFRCIGKGLVNAYSFMVRLKSILFLPWLTKGRVNVFWIFDYGKQLECASFLSSHSSIPMEQMCTQSYDVLTRSLHSLITNLFPQPSQLLTFPFDLAVVVCKLLCGLHVLFCHTATLSQMWRM